MDTKKCYILHSDFITFFRNYFVEEILSRKEDGVEKQGVFKLLTLSISLRDVFLHTFNHMSQSTKCE